jgi:hypothetical protein
VTWRGGVMTSTGGEVAVGRGKGGADASWADTNLSMKKLKKIHAVNSASINGQ